MLFVVFSFFSLDPPLFRFNKKWFACWLINYFTLRLRHGWTMKRKRTEWISKLAGVCDLLCMSQGFKERLTERIARRVFVTLACCICLCVKFMSLRKRQFRSVAPWVLRYWLFSHSLHVRCIDFDLKKIFQSQDKIF